METTARTALSKIWVKLTAAAVLCTVAVIYYRESGPGRVATQLMDSVMARNWDQTYTYMGPLERDQLKMDPAQFKLFCTRIAAQGWPKADHPELEEMTPYVSPTTLTDTVWTTSGTHRFSVTLRRPDGQVDIHTTIEYRHDPSGEWHPDVLPFIFSISRGTPGGHPVKGLLDGMTAIHIDRLETYPLHQRTSVAKLKALLAKRRGFYLETPLQYFH